MKLIAIVMIIKRKSNLENLVVELLQFSEKIVNPLNFDKK